MAKHTVRFDGADRRPAVSRLEQIERDVGCELAAKLRLMARKRDYGEIVVRVPVEAGVPLCADVSTTVRVRHGKDQAA